MKELVRSPTPGTMPIVMSVPIFNIPHIKTSMSVDFIFEFLMIICETSFPFMFITCVLLM